LPLTLTKSHSHPLIFPFPEAVSFRTQTTLQ
jgi:hypothetical protein